MSNITYTLSAIIGGALLATNSCAEQPKTNNPVEAGHVKWGRNLETSKKEMAKNGKPILLLFQEVPG